MNMSNATKYSARDSATSALRKIGIVKSDYDDFIVKRDGVFYCDIEGAKKFVDKTVASSTVTAPKVDHTASNKTIAKLINSTKAKAEKPAETKPVAGIASVIRALILEGKSNADIWAQLGPNGTKVLAENRKSYPAWFRCELRRKGHNV